jgi:fructokinase
MGGGVLNQKQVFPYIYSHLKELLNDYVALPDLSEYIVSPGLGDDAGITGAIMLAKQVLEEQVKG